MKNRVYYLQKQAGNPRIPIWARCYKGVCTCNGSADKALVFYSAKALELKRMLPLDPDHVKGGFARKGLEMIKFGTGIVAWLSLGLL